ncbi:hypothetical protein FJZ28_00930 [Candidatus Peregrinibacteria bacterium]|nr:hypothetical protein [Candidatus Peregrinibacteria bacterium]
MKRVGIIGFAVISIILLVPPVMANQSGDATTAKERGIDFRRANINDRYKFTRRHLETQMYTAGTGSLTTHRQRIENLRVSQRRKQTEDIQERQFNSGRVLSPRATEPPRDILDNARVPTPHRRTGRPIDDPRLKQQELREEQKINRIDKLKYSNPGECAGMRGTRLALCLYNLRPGSK